MVGRGQRFAGVLLHQPEALGGRSDPWCGETHGVVMAKNCRMTIFMTRFDHVVIAQEKS